MICEFGWIRELLGGRYNLSAVIGKLLAYGLGLYLPCIYCEASIQCRKLRVLVSCAGAIRPRLWLRTASPYLLLLRGREWASYYLHTDTAGEEGCNNAAVAAVLWTINTPGKSVSLAGRYHLPERCTLRPCSLHGTHLQIVISMNNA